MFRDYIYVEDFATMVSTMIQRGASRSVYNIGSGCKTTVSEIMASIERVTGATPEIQHVPTPSTYLLGIRHSTRSSERVRPLLATSLDGDRENMAGIQAHGC